MYWSEVIVCFTKPNYFGVLPHPDIQDDCASSSDPLPHERVGSGDKATCTHAVLTFAPLKLAASSVKLGMFVVKYVRVCLLLSAVKQQVNNTQAAQLLRCIS